MSILDIIPHTLFRMLCSPAHVRNVAVLEKLFEQFFDDFAFAPSKAEVQNVIRQILNDPLYSTITDDGEILGNPEATEYFIYNRLKEDGWILEVKNRRVVELHMPREAHALLSALATLKEELKVDISAEASLIDSGIAAAYEDPVGKVLSIASARRQAVQLRRSIDGVLTSLHRIEEDLMQSDGLADLLARFMERFVEKLLLENYRTLKASTYNPMRFQRSIKQNAERFMNDEGQLARAAAALADQGIARDPQSAKEQLLQDLSKIRDIFVGLGEKLDLIDRFSYKLERRIATTVRYQETARNVKEEAIRSAIRVAFAGLAHGEEACVSPLAGIPVSHSTATLANPKKARQPVDPQERRRKVVDPADVIREAMMDKFAADMSVTTHAVAERLLAFAKSDRFTDLNDFVPQDARDVAILYEARAGTLGDVPGLEIRRGVARTANMYVSGPSILVRRAGDKP